ncbi:MAG: hypothetical protein SGPRY_014251, partial [Prymnesium sp.]
DIFILLLIESLGTLGSRLGGAGQYQLMLNEYAMGELEASSLISTGTAIALATSFLSAPLVDILGVRSVALCSLALSSLKLAALVFTRAKWVLVVVVLTPDIFPFGLAVYAIGLKNLTTPTTRPTAFALSSVLLNLAIFIGLGLVDITRQVVLLLSLFPFSSPAACLLLTS